MYNDPQGDSGTGPETAAAAPVRVALLADTHGWVDPRVLAVVAGCDLAVHGGDIGNPGVLARLRPRRGRVWVVRGNNDRPADWPAADRAMLEQVPSWARVSLPGGELIVIHGHQTPARDRHARLRRRFPLARALVCGHSHRLVLDREAMPWVLNPGAAGRTRTHGGPSCLVLTAGAETWEVEVHQFPMPARTAGGYPGRNRPARSSNARDSANPGPAPNADPDPAPAPAPAAPIDPDA